MCACEPGYVCSRCAGTTHDPLYLERRDDREDAIRARWLEDAEPYDREAELDAALR